MGPLLFIICVRASHYTANPSPWPSIFNAAVRSFNKESRQVRVRLSLERAQSACAHSFFYAPILMLYVEHIPHSDFHLWGARRAEITSLAVNIFVERTVRAHRFLLAPSAFQCVALCIYSAGTWCKPACKCRRRDACCRLVILFGQDQSEMCKYFALFHPVPHRFLLPRLFIELHFKAALNFN